LTDALVVTCPYSLIIGRQVDAINNEKVKVEWSENNGEDVVYLVTTRRLNLNRKESYSIKIK
jgi:hypothetical protein